MKDFILRKSTLFFASAKFFLEKYIFADNNFIDL